MQFQGAAHCLVMLHARRRSVGGFIQLCAHAVKRTTLWGICVVIMYQFHVCRPRPYVHIMHVYMHVKASCVHRVFCAGSNVSLTLYFMRFAFWLNVLMLAIWVVLAVFPFFDSPPTSFSWKLFKETSPGLMVQGYGLDDTFLVYGKFP